MIEVSDVREVACWLHVPGAGGPEPAVSTPAESVA